MDTLLVTGLAAALALVSLGGHAYQALVVDASWPQRPTLIQPARGGLSRKRFWIPAHVAFELALVVALALTWTSPEIRVWLLVALASHVAMRLWSALSFIPASLAFERADPARIEPTNARAWTRRSLLRLPLDLVTGGAMLAAFAEAARLA